MPQTRTEAFSGDWALKSGGFSQPPEDLAAKLGQYPAGKLFRKCF
jgi:hypothetical protein